MKRTDYLDITLYGLTAYRDSLSVFFYDQYKKSGEEVTMFVTGMRKVLEALNAKIEQAKARTLDEVTDIRIPILRISPNYTGHIGKGDIQVLAEGLKQAWERIRDEEEQKTAARPDPEPELNPLTNAKMEVLREQGKKYFPQLEKVLFNRGYIDENREWKRPKTELVALLNVLKESKYFFKSCLKNNADRKFISVLYQKDISQEAKPGRKDATKRYEGEFKTILEHVKNSLEA